MQIVGSQTFGCRYSPSIGRTISCIWILEESLSVNVEKAAVNKLESLLLECRHLDPYIDTNDRTPFTDGHIEIYSSGSHEKRNFIGKVSVQVKGRTIPKSGKWTPSIPISRVDVDGYLKEGGVLYFVVFVNPRTRTKKPFYTNLSPYRIRDILGGNTSYPKRSDGSVKEDAI